MGERHWAASRITPAGADRRSKHELAPTERYVRIKTAFRRRALRRLKGVKLAVFLSLALHVDSDHITSLSLEQIMGETGYGRTAVCSALAELRSPRLRLLKRLPRKGRGPARYRIEGYIWYGRDPAPAIYELEEEGSSM